MKMDLDALQEQLPQQQMKVSPRLVAANHILQLSSLELQQAISTELTDNPALEMIDVPTCPTCGTQLQGSICPSCLRRQKADNDLVDGPDANDESYYGHNPAGQPRRSSTRSHRSRPRSACRRGCSPSCEPWSPGAFCRWPSTWWATWTRRAT